MDVKKAVLQGMRDYAEEAQRLAEACVSPDVQAGDYSACIEHSDKAHCRRLDADIAQARECEAWHNMARDAWRNHDWFADPDWPFVLPPCPQAQPSWNFFERLVCHEFVLPDQHRHK